MTPAGVGRQEIGRAEPLTNGKRGQPAESTERRQQRFRDRPRQTRRRGPHHARPLRAILREPAIQESLSSSPASISRSVSNECRSICNRIDGSRSTPARMRAAFLWGSSRFVASP